MKRIVRIEKCRKCKSQKWQRHSTSICISIIDDESYYEFDKSVSVKTVFVCSVCETKTYTDPLSETFAPEYNDFQKEEYGERLRVKPQHHGDTELIKWSQKYDGYEVRPYNSYTLVLDEKGAWVDKHGNRVTCYSINGCGEVRWSLSMSNSVDEYSIVKKFGLIWSPLEQWSSKPYWLEKAEQEEQAKKEQDDK
jgi:hypothetical protein